MKDVISEEDYRRAEYVIEEVQRVLDVCDALERGDYETVGEKMYETLLTNEECANAIDMGNFYRVPCDKRDLNYDKYFKDGDVERNPLTEFNSNNTDLLTVEQVKEKMLELQYIKDELAEWESR